MFSDSEEIFAEFGLEEVAITEKLEIKQDSDVSEVSFMNTAQSQTAVTSVSYDVTLETRQPVDVQQFFGSNGVPDRLDVVFTGITLPESVTFEDAIITSTREHLESSEIEFTAADITTEYLF